MRDGEGRSCPDCGASVSEAFQFCPSCGIQLPALVRSIAESTSLPASPAGSPANVDLGAPSWRAERRLVSVLFVDLVGFTTLSEDLDPEDVREIQSRYFEMARSSITRYGGMVEKFIGDAVMAVWGSPVARENDAERAVRAALEIVAAVGSMPVVTHAGAKLAARAAVTTGEAAVSFDVDGEGMVTGDMVNTASRLQDSATAGSVLVDNATRRAVGDSVTFEHAGEKALKGKASTVSTWRALEPSTPEGSDSVAGHRGPFIGRAAELLALRQLVELVLQERNITLASITGVAGIGKSRLVHELERDMRGSPQLRWYRGRPPRWGEGSAFAPIAEIVRRMLGLAKGEPEEVMRRTLATQIARMVPESAEREWIATRVGVLLGVPADGMAEREELFSAWRRFIEAQSEAEPVVLVFEDLQWADPDTFDFIDYLTIWSHRHPILVLAISRPELLERRPTWGAGIPNFRSMHLDRLSDAEIDELLRALAPDLPAHVAEQVRRRAEGVPLYAVEIARMLTERGEQPGVPGYDIPESLHALLAARIDALPEEERTVLLMAAVLGRRFRQESLAGLSALERAELGARVGTLIRREFLAIDDEPTSPGRGQLTFVQDMMREVAYGTLSRRDRRTYHEAVIEQLTAADEAQDIEPIAEHLLAAHAAAGAHQVEAGAIARRAVHALRRAAEHAEAQHAPQRALAHLDRALALAEEPHVRAELAESAAIAARAAARFGVAESHLRNAIDLRDSLGDAVASARDRAQLASVLLQAQRSDTALAELEGAWDSYSKAGGKDAAMVHLAAELARAYMLRGDTEAAISWASRAIAAAEEEGSGEASGYAIEARVSLGTALAQADRPDEGLEQLNSAMRLAADAGLVSVELRARTNLAWLTASDDPRAAADTARRGVEVARQVGSREWLLQLLDIAGILGLETGDWAWTLDQFAQVAEADLPTAYRLDFAATEAMIHALRGDPQPLAALDALGEHEPDLDAHALGWTLLARAVAATAAADIPAGLSLTRSVAANAIGFERAEALLLHGRLAVWSGQIDEAAGALEALEAEPGWGRVADARVATLRAAVNASRGPAPGDPWEAPLATWRELDLPLREGLCLADRWFVRGDPADRDAATRRLEALGARALTATISDRDAFLDQAS
ncbi:MAG TPA: adenylate/guanylate cyclase domain-containing protein [Candidatus Limnocylindria bacterium]